MCIRDRYRRRNPAAAAAMAEERKCAGSIPADFYFHWAGAGKRRCESGHGGVDGKTAGSPSFRREKGKRGLRNDRVIEGNCFGGSGQRQSGGFLYGNRCGGSPPCLLYTSISSRGFRQGNSCFTMTAVRFVCCGISTVSYLLKATKTAIFPLTVW